MPRETSCHTCGGGGHCRVCEAKKLKMSEPLDKAPPGSGDEPHLLSHEESLYPKPQWHG